MYLENISHFSFLTDNLMKIFLIYFLIVSLDFLINNDYYHVDFD